LEIKSSPPNFHPLAQENQAGHLVLSLRLTLNYDLRKAADRGMLVSDVRLLEKPGGKSGDWLAG
jgi:hypothetical protein